MDEDARSGAFFDFGVEIRSPLDAQRLNEVRKMRGFTVSLNTTNVYAEVDLEMKAQALETCEIRAPQPQKHWRYDLALLQFLRTL
jgi:integrase/recombinase XerD